MRTAWVLAACLLLGALALGCGGDDAAKRPAPPPAATRESRYRAGLLTAARQYRAATELGLRRGRRAATPAQAAATSDAVIAATATFVRRLRGLDSPRPVVERHERLVAAYSRVLLAFSRLREAARGGRTRDVQRRAREVRAGSPVFRELARAGAGLRTAGYDVERELRTPVRS